jgi:hypothetical protein
MMVVCDMVYVKGYKGYRMWVPRKCCRFCGYYDGDASRCEQTMEHVRGEHVCNFYSPAGEGGGE